MAIFNGKVPFFLCYVFLISCPMGFSLSESEALLQLKKSLNDTEMIDSWKSGENPCSLHEAKWSGIKCQTGVVTHIELENMGLSGNIDVDALVEMNHLRVVSFIGNYFTGPIPKLNQLGTLRAIFLSENQFSGEIPKDFFKGMGSLKRVHLNGNNFTGNIPSSLVDLTGIVSLRLEYNQFSGRIPPIEISTMEDFDIENNNLEGEIPSTLSRFDANSFRGNPGLCGEKIGKECPENGSNWGLEKKSRTIAMALIGSSVGILAIVIVAIVLIRRKQKKFKILEKNNFDGSIGSSHHTNGRGTSLNRRGFESGKRGSISNRGGNGTGDLVVVNEDNGRFGLNDLMKAGAEVLGTGILGSSYKATMSNGMTVVVKRIKDMNKVGTHEGFDTEIKRFGRLRHPNVLAPLAYHYRKEEKLLISKYAPKGNLLFLLHGDRGPSHAELSWPTRLKIVGGITRGLYYLHTELPSESLPHGNLKSSNILLGQGFEPLLVDYGFSSLLSTQQAAQAIQAYKTSEAESSYQVSPKSDIYCLGIIILEILTGKSHNNYSNGGKGGIDVVHWVRSAVLDNRESEVLDPEVLDKINADEMERLLHVGSCCVERSPELRPDVREVLRRVEEIERECARTHGYGGLMVHGSHLSHVQSGSYGSTRRLESIGARSERRNNDNHPFDIS